MRGNLEQISTPGSICERQRGARKPTPPSFACILKTKIWSSGCGPFPCLLVETEEQGSGTESCTMLVWGNRWAHTWLFLIHIQGLSGQHRWVCHCHRRLQKVCRKIYTKMTIQTGNHRLTTKSILKWSTHLCRSMWVTLTRAGNLGMTPVHHKVCRETTPCQAGVLD